jgi:hypothetical protein
VSAGPEIRPIPAAGVPVGVAVVSKIVESLAAQPTGGGGEAETRGRQATIASSTANGDSAELAVGSVGPTGHANGAEILSALAKCLSETHEGRAEPIRLLASLPAVRREPST